MTTQTQTPLVRFKDKLISPVVLDTSELLYQLESNARYSMKLREHAEARTLPAFRYLALTKGIESDNAAIREALTARGVVLCEDCNLRESTGEDDDASLCDVCGTALLDKWLVGEDC